MPNKPLILIENANLFAPQALGKQCVLIGGPLEARVQKK